MGYLDPVPKRFKPKPRPKSSDDNFSELQNLGHEKVKEDFSDSKFANHQPSKGHSIDVDGNCNMGCC